jgi:pyruvate-ferredoxin/flavodoxin oxidoreductase
VPLTFADFAVTEARFRKHFRRRPADTWNENMVPLAEFLARCRPRTARASSPHLVGGPQAAAVAAPGGQHHDRRARGAADFWIMLRHRRGAPAARRRPRIERGRIDRRSSGRSPQGLCSWAGPGSVLTLRAQAVLVPMRTARSNGHGRRTAAGPRRAVSTWRRGSTPSSAPRATSASRSTTRSSPTTPKKAFIRNPAGGPYKDLVKAAEKCTARSSTPGCPRTAAPRTSRSWIARGEKYN